MKDVRRLLDRLAAAEDDFLRQEFLAPVVRTAEVRVRISGVVCRMRTEPADFEGWGVFLPFSHRAARLVRRATLAERRHYLDLFPRLRMILCRRDENRWLAIAAHRGDQRFRIEGMVAVQLTEEAQLFEIVACRFDGSQFWYESADPRHDPATAAWLRQSLQEMAEPERLERPGLTAEERLAYALGYFPRLEARRQTERDRIEDRLRAALAHAGAELREYMEHPDGYRITYTVAGRRHVSSVDKRDLTVQAAGICLSGQDRAFDLQSLVGVLREAASGGLARDPDD